jgi:hypothetical protein
MNAFGIRTDQRLAIALVIRRLLALAGFAWTAWSLAHSQPREAGDVPAARRSGARPPQGMSAGEQPADGAGPEVSDERAAA